MSLYRRLVGDGYDRLPEVLRAFHAGPGIARGRLRITRGKGGPLRALVAALARLPAPGDDVPTTLTVTPQGDGEIWDRQLGAARLKTFQWEQGGKMWERVGPLTFVARVEADAGGLTFVHDHVRLLGLRLPEALSPWTVGGATAEGDGWRVSTKIGLPLLGEIVAYEGVVRPEEAP